MRAVVAADLAQLMAQPIAHRGLHSCGSKEPVENSLGAARAAIAKGFGIECDVRLSHDGEAMVFHDAALGRLTGAPGLVEELDATALKRLRLRGSRDQIPTLADLLAEIAGRVPLVIEIKTARDGDLRLVDRTLDILASYAGPVAVESFDPAVVLRCLDGGSQPAGLVGPSDSPEPRDPAVFAACDFLSWSIDHIGDAARDHPTLPRTTWTVRTAAQREVAARHNAQIVFEGALLPEVNVILKH